MIFARAAEVAKIQLAAALPIVPRAPRPSRLAAAAALLGEFALHLAAQDASAGSLVGRHAGNRGAERLRHLAKLVDRLPQLDASELLAQGPVGKQACAIAVSIGGRPLADPAAVRALDHGLEYRLALGRAAAALIRLLTQRAGETRRRR